MGELKEIYDNMSAIKVLEIAGGNIKACREIIEGLVSDLDDSRQRVRELEESFRFLWVRNGKKWKGSRVEFDGFVDHILAQVLAHPAGIEKCSDADCICKRWNGKAE